MSKAKYPAKTQENLDTYRKYALDAIENGDKYYTSTPDDTTYYDYWLDMALRYNRLTVAKIILDMYNVPDSSMSVKERATYYYLTCKEQ